MKRAALAIALLALPVPAFAHPHVFVDMVTQINVGNDGLIKGVRLSWAFDDAYAQVALEGMDANGDGTYSPAELEQLTKENLSSITDYGYFTVMRLQGKKLEIAGAGNATQTYIDDRLRLEFDLDLKTPVDPKQGGFEVKIYDSDFFIAFDYAKENPTVVTGQLQQGCAMNLKPPPTGEEIEAKREFLASKPVDWKPEPGEEEDFGALFAQALVVQCAS